MEIVRNPRTGGVTTGKGWMAKADNLELRCKMLEALVRKVADDTYCDGPGCQYCEAEERHPKTVLAKEADELLERLEKGEG